MRRGNQVWMVNLLTAKDFLFQMLITIRSSRWEVESLVSTLICQPRWNRLKHCWLSSTLWTVCQVTRPPPSNNLKKNQKQLKPPPLTPTNPKSNQPKTKLLSLAYGSQTSKKAVHRQMLDFFSLILSSLSETSSQRHQWHLVIYKLESKMHVQRHWRRIKLPFS